MILFQQNLFSTTVYSHYANLNFNICKYTPPTFSCMFDFKIHAKKAEMQKKTKMQKKAKMQKRAEMQKRVENACSI